MGDVTPTEVDVELTAHALQVEGTPPSPREGHSMVVLDSYRVLVFGGGCSSPSFGPLQFNDLFLLDLKESKWSAVQSKGVPPSARTGHSALLLGDNRVIVFGGLSMLEGYKNDVWILDTKEWEWSQPEVATIPPCPRDKHSACVVGSKLYVFGGFGPADDKNCGICENEGASSSGDSENEEYGSEEDFGQAMSFTWFNDLHVLHATTMTWQKIETCGERPTPRAAHSAFIDISVGHLNGNLCHKMVTFGGRGPTGRTNDLFFLNLQTLEWNKAYPVVDLSQSISSANGFCKVSDPPASRSFHVMVSVGTNSQLAVSFGGVGADGEFFRGLDVLDTKAMRWYKLSRMRGTWPPLRGSSAMVCLPSHQSGEIQRLVIFGGSCCAEDREPVYFNDAYAIDLVPLISLSKGLQL